MNLAQMLLTSLLSAVAAGMGSGVAWLLMRRQLERIDGLKREIGVLKSNDLTAMRGSISAGGDSRKVIYEKIARIEREFVHKTECHNNFAQIQQRLESFTALRDDVVRACERADTASRSAGALLDRTINLKGDLEHIAGIIEAERKNR